MPVIFLIALLIERGVDIVFQQHASRKVDFKKGKQIGARDHIVTWEKPKKMPHWMTKKQYDSFPNTLEIRELKVNKKVIVSTMLSDKYATKKELGVLYKQRWHVELDRRNIKDTLGMGVLSCKIPEMNKKMWIYFFA